MLPDVRKRLKDYDGNLAQEVSNAWGLKDPLYTTIVKTFGKVKGRGTTKTVNEDVLDIMANPEKYKTFPMPDGKKVNLFDKHKLFIIREPQKILGRSSSDLLEICKNPNPGYLIFLISDDWNAKSNFLRKIENI